MHLDPPSASAVHFLPGLRFLPPTSSAPAQPQPACSTALPEPSRLLNGMDLKQTKKISFPKRQRRPGIKLNSHSARFPPSGHSCRPEEEEEAATCLARPHVGLEVPGRLALLAPGAEAPPPAAAAAEGFQASSLPPSSESCRRSPTLFGPCRFAALRLAFHPGYFFPEDVRVPLARPPPTSSFLCPIAFAGRVSPRSPKSRSSSSSSFLSPCERRQHISPRRGRPWEIHRKDSSQEFFCAYTK